MELVRVESHPNLARTRSGAIININRNEIVAARIAKLKRREKEKEDKVLRNQVNYLTHEVSELKTILLKIAEKL